MTLMTLQALHTLVADDAFTSTFQSVSQYRGALLRAFNYLIANPTQTCMTASSEYVTVSSVTVRQALIALGKFANGYRPGAEGWAPEDDAALEAAHFKQREMKSEAAIS